MKKLVSSFFLLCVALLLTACDGTKEGTVAMKQYEQLSEGWTKVAVEESYGPPLEKEEENEWIYDLITEEKETIRLTPFLTVTSWPPLSRRRKKINFSIEKPEPHHGDAPVVKLQISDTVLPV